MLQNLTAADRLLPGVPRIESPFFEDIFAELQVDATVLRVARELHHNGYSIIDFPDDHLAERAEAIKRDLHDRFDWHSWRQRGGGLRTQDAWARQADIRALAVNRSVLELLSLLYGRKAWPFQTLNFPVGTEQHFHSDAVHFHSMPERFMCGVWLALEDVDESSGPLIYYPGSHKWPVVDNDQLSIHAAGIHPEPSQGLYEPLWRALVKKHGIAPERFAARKGQALIWTANLLHGGAPHLDRGRTRWSQVTHYYFEGCAYFTPMHSNPAAGAIAYRSLRDIDTGRMVPNRYAGGAIGPGLALAARLRTHGGALKYAWHRLRRRSR